MVERLLCMQEAQGSIPCSSRYVLHAPSILVQRYLISDCSLKGSTSLVFVCDAGDSLIALLLEHQLFFPLRNERAKKKWSQWGLNP
jgi:hypothetical protein